jgi:hypothetical protein
VYLDDGDLKSTTPDRSGRKSCRESIQVRYGQVQLPRPRAHRNANPWKATRIITELK